MVNLMRESVCLSRLLVKRIRPQCGGEWLPTTRRTVFELFGVVFRAHTKSPRVLDATDATAHFSQRQILVNAVVSMGRRNTRLEPPCIEGCCIDRLSWHA